MKSILLTIVTVASTHAFAAPINCRTEIYNTDYGVSLTLDTNKATASLFEQSIRGNVKVATLKCRAVNQGAEVNTSAKHFVYFCKGTNEYKVSIVDQGYNQGLLASVMQGTDVTAEMPCVSAMHMN